MEEIAQILEGLAGIKIVVVHALSIILGTEYGINLEGLLIRNILSSWLDKNYAQLAVFAQ